MENSFSFFRKVQLYALCVILQDKIFFLTYVRAIYIHPPYDRTFFVTYYIFVHFYHFIVEFAL